MINEEKVKLMTQLSILEESIGRENFMITSYYRSDYIAIQLMKTFLLTTIGYGILSGGGFLLYAQKVSLLGALELKKALLFLVVGYVCVLLVYLMLTYFKAADRHKQASQFMHLYHKEYALLERGYLTQESLSKDTEGEGQ